VVVAVFLLKYLFLGGGVKYMYALYTVLYMVYIYGSGQPYLCAPNATTHFAYFPKITPGAPLAAAVPSPLPLYSREPAAPHTTHVSAPTTAGERCLP